jgi:hypothetical protein
MGGRAAVSAHGLRSPTAAEKKTGADRARENRDMRKRSAVALAIAFAGSAFANELSPAELEKRAIERRAVEAVIWGMPAVNYDLMYQEMRRLGGRSGQIVVWPGLLDWRNQTLTPNPDVIYLMAFFSTKDGPMVIEIPPAGDGVINGSIMGPWQAALEDVGPAGADKGAGGKYLILPPGYTLKPPDGYIVLPSANFQGYALLRSILKSGKKTDVEAALAYGRRIKLYPYDQAASPPETTFLDASGAMFDSTIPYDIRFFRSLDRIVQTEPWLERDKAMIDQLKSIGIEKGRPFDPDSATQGILEAAASEARAWLDLLYEEIFPAYYEGRKWVFPILPEVIGGLQSQFADDRATHALIRDLPRSGRSSQSPGLRTNADGSVDIYFGAKAPDDKEANWVPTKAQGKFEVLFRFYGPEKAVFDKTWKLPDIERTY